MLLLGVAEREHDLESRVARRRFDPDVAVVAPDDDAPGDVEAEPGALPDGLGGEERLEDPAADVVGYTGTGVGDLDDEPVVVVGTGPHRERAAAVHGID